MSGLSKLELSMPLWLYGNGREYQKCHLNGLTLEGLSVHTDETGLVKKGALLTAIFYVSIDGVVKRCEETVRVGQVKEHSAGLDYVCFDHAHSINIEKLIHVAKVMAEHRGRESYRVAERHTL